MERLRQKLILTLTGGKNGRGTIFYYGFWTVILFSKSLNLTAQDRMLQLLMLLALGLLGLKFLCTDWDLRSCIWGWLLCSLGVLTYFGSGSSELLVTLAAIVGAKDVKLKPLIAYIFGLRLIIFVATIAMALTGIVENVSEYIEDFDGNLVKGQRFYLGFIHPNYAQVSLFVLIALYAWLRFEKLNILHICVFLGFNFLLYRYTLSRTGMSLICLLCLSFALLRREALFPVGKLFIVMPSLIAVLCLAIGVAYPYCAEHPFIRSLNDALSGRIALIERFLRYDYPTSLFGSEKVTNSPYVLDNAYIMLLQQYGMVVFLLFVAGATVLLSRLYRAKNAPALIVLGNFIVLGFFEHFTIDVFLNVSLLCFAPMLFGSRVEPEFRVAFMRPVRAERRAGSFAGGFAYYLFFTILQVAVPLVTVVYVSKILGADGIGKVSFAQTFVSYFTIIASLGIPNYGTREISKAKEGVELNRTFTQIFAINAVSTTVCLAAYVLVICATGYFRENFGLYLVSGVSIALNYCNVDWLYRGTERYPYLTDSSLMMKIACLVGMLIAVQKEGDVVPYALLSALALTGAGVFNLIESKRFVRFDWSAFDWKKHLKPVFVLLAANIAIELYTLLDTTMLGILKTDAEVGYYTNAMKLVKTTVTVMTALGAVLLPRLSVAFKGRGEELRTMIERALGVIVLVCVPATVGIYLLADSMVIALFGVDFFPAVPILEVLAPLVLIMGVGNLFGTQVLLSVNAEKKLCISVAIGAAINLCLNSLLIPAFGGKGAALASVVSELAVAAVQVAFALRYCRISLPAGEYGKIALATLVMSAAVVALRMAILSAALELVICIALGAAIYFAVCALLRVRDVKEGGAMLKGLLLRRRAHD